MLNTLKMTFKIDMAYAINSFIYLLRKIPILKNIIPDNLYGYSSLKDFIRILGIVLTTGRLILYRLIYFFIIYGISSIICNENIEFAFIHIYIIFAFIGLIINNRLLSVSTKKYFSIILFKMDAKKYLCADFIQGLILSFILNLIGFSVISIFIDIPILIILGLTLFSSFCRIIGEAISIWFYKKFGNLLVYKYWFTYSYILVMLVVSFLPFFGIGISNDLFLLDLILLFIMSIVSFLFIMNVDDYEIIYKRLNTAKTAMNEKYSEAYTRQAMVDIKDKDKIIDNKSLEGKKGYDLFNTIFFERHKAILLSSVKKYSLVIGIIIVLLIVLVLINESFAKGINNFLLNRLGWFVIIMYFINRGAIITQAMFYNCDHAMLSYNFYREPKVLLNLFSKRLSTLVKINLIPSVVIAIGIVILLYLSGSTILINYITVPLFIILLSIFFSVHYLVIYYLLQPFNKDLEMKKVSYSIVSGLTYFISYTIVDVRMSSLLFSISGLVFTIFYIIIALVLVYKFAPKTFKINN